MSWWDDVERRWEMWWCDDDVMRWFLIATLRIIDGDRPGDDCWSEVESHFHSQDQIGKMKFCSLFIFCLVFVGTSSSAAPLKTPSSALLSTNINHLRNMLRKQTPVACSDPYASVTPTPVTDVAPYMRHLPNVLSLARLAAIPLFVYAFFSYSKTFASSIFVLASLTDFLDGFIARKYKLTSEFGAFIDPVADKVTCNGVSHATHTRTDRHTDASYPHRMTAKLFSI